MKFTRAIAVMLCLLLPLQAVASLALTGCADMMAASASAGAETGMDCHAAAPPTPEQSGMHDCCSGGETPASEECSHCDLCLQSAPVGVVMRLLPSPPGLSHAISTPAPALALSDHPSSLLRPPQIASRAI